MIYRRDLIESGTKRRSGLVMPKVIFIVAHDTGNINSTAKNNVDYFKRSADEMSASAHLFVDDLECVECIPISEKAWHVLYDKPLDNTLFGDDANDIAVGVELCYFDDLPRSFKAYRNYVEILVGLCKGHNLSPRKHIVGHSKLDPQRKTDPENALKRIGKTFENLISDVEKEMKVSTDKQLGIAAVEFLAGVGRLSSPGSWTDHILKGTIPNLEYLFIKWMEDYKR